MQEDLLAIIRTDKAKAFLLVVKLNLAGWHENLTSYGRIKLPNSIILYSVTPQTSPPASRIQRTLAYIVAALIVVSLICIALILIGSAAGWLPHSQAAAEHGLWPMVSLIPLIALPIGFILIIVLLIISARNRAKLAKESTTPTRSRNKR